MTLAARLSIAGILLFPIAAPAHAQEPPSKIGPLVVDVHGAFVKFPATQEVADSRGLQLGELPDTAFGGDIGVHLYLFKWKALTFGVGGEVTAMRAHNVPAASALQTTPLSPVTEKFLSAAPQISFNFGSGGGWSYISGGVGLAQWSIIPDGAESQDADTERLRTFNYGGGARWFIKKHLAFSFDVRIYAINPGTPTFGFAGSPRTSLTVIGAGVSVK